MPPVPKIITWRKVDTQKLTNVVRQFNGKLTRAIAKNPDFVNALPNRINRAELEAYLKTTTRNEFNRTIRSLQRFLRADALQPKVNSQGVVTTKWEYRETQIRNNIRNARRREQREQANPSPLAGNIATVEDANLSPVNFNFERMSVEDWKAFVESVNAQSSDMHRSQAAESYKAIYLQKIDENLGTAGDELYFFVASLPAILIYDNYLNDPVLNIQFTSDPIPSKLIADSALARWKRVLNAATLAEELLNG